MKAITIFALAALTLMGETASMKAQTVISNETLVTTTFVVNKTPATAKCDKVGCTAHVPMLKSIPVTCPAAIGQTCTFHIALDAKVALSFDLFGYRACFSTGFNGYEFLIDGALPTVGPIDPGGNYLFAVNVYTCTENSGGIFNRQSYPASVIATVTNTNSTSHTIDVNLVCGDSLKQGGCEAIAHNSAMRVDVFEP
jgi:hypothetical protein